MEGDGEDDQQQENADTQGMFGGGDEAGNDDDDGPEDGWEVECRFGDGGCKGDDVEVAAEAEETPAGKAEEDEAADSMVLLTAFLDIAASFIVCGVDG